MPLQPLNNPSAVQVQVTATSTVTTTPVGGTTIDLQMTNGGNGSYVITETGGLNGVTVNIDASNDNQNWSPAVSTATIQAGTTFSLDIGVTTGRFQRCSIVSAILSPSKSGTVLITGFAM